MNNELQIQHQNALGALLQLKQICEKHHLSYYLLAGSVLGAVRHGGFIPWDDDIDVGVKFDDIAVLEKYLDQELTDGYRYVTYSLDNNFPRLHGKILYKGRSCIDIFPLVRLSDKAWIRKFQWMLKSFTKKIYYRKCHYFDKTENPTLVKIAKICAVFFSKKRILAINEWNCKLCNSKNTKYWSNFYSVYSMQREMIESKMLERPAVLTFEGHKFLSVGYPKRYLTNLYGDYMTLPPEEKRVCGHEEIFEEYK